MGELPLSMKYYNNVDSDQLASTDLDLHCFQKRIYTGAAGQGIGDKFPALLGLY